MGRCWRLAGVFDSVDDTLESVLGDGALTVTQYFSFGRVLSVALLIGAIDVVLITALATIGAFLFNLAASLVGGLEVSATERGLDLRRRSPGLGGPWRQVAFSFGTGL